MLVSPPIRLVMIISLLSLLLSGCFHPPFNNFNHDHQKLKQIAFGAGLGAGTGAVIGSIAGSAPAGALIGGLAGAATGAYYNTKHALLTELQRQDIQYIKYGDTITLVIPTDRYFIFNSPTINDICYPGLNNIIRILRYYPKTTIYVAAFTDNVGSRHHKKMLSQARAETMLTFLWAHDIHAQRLHAEGYAEGYAIGDNHLIHGSAYNRRIEIQWQDSPCCVPQPAPYLCAVK